MSEQQEAYTADPAPIDLGEAVRQLAKWRDSLATANSRMAEMREQLEQEIEYQFWQGMADEASRAAADLEKELRQTALDAYAARHEKHVHNAISIRVNVRLVYDEQDALDWSGLYLPKALKLDARLFEKHARAVLDTAPLPFVEIVTEPTAIIQSVLSHYLIDRAK